MNAVTPSPDLRAPLLVSLAVHIFLVGVMGLSALPKGVVIPEPKILTLQLQPPLKTPQQTMLSTPPPVKNPPITATTPTPPAAIVQEKTHKTSPIIGADTIHSTNTATVNQPTITATINATTSNVESTPLIAPVSNQPNAIDNEQVPIFDAAYLNNPQPNYPLLAKKRQQQGMVLLRVKVSIDGKSEAVELNKSSGFELLDEAAQNAVKTWRFVPAKKGNDVVSAWVIVPIIFKLS